FLHVLLPLLSLFPSAHTFVLEQRACVPSDIGLVKQQVQHPDYFCTWYLSETRSPLPKIDPDALLGACKCIINAAQSGTWSRDKKAIQDAARMQSFVPAGCPSSASNFIKNEFKDSVDFCHFWQYM
ncbi:unnamed protein product, partial [Aureobasidium mustum]